MVSGDLTSGVGGGGTLLCILTVRVAPVTIADMDIIDVGMGLQCEDEANQVRSRQEDRNRVHKRPAKKPQKNITTQNNIKLIMQEECCAIKHQYLLNTGQNQVWITLTLL